MTLERQRVRRLLGACWTPRSDGWADPLYGLAIGAAYVALLLGTLDNLGYARDEGFYFQAATHYQRWFELLWKEPEQALATVDFYWRVNSEHPALVKSLFALSHALFWDRFRAVAMEGTSFRLPAMVLSGLAVGLVYLWAARAQGRLAGVLAAGSLAAMPRFFFHAHLACFDAPVVAMWTLCAYTWWRTLQRGTWWRAAATGVTFALALSTKHNSWFLPVVFGLHALLAQLPGAARGISPSLLRRRAFTALVCMSVIGPLVFYASWPWLWHDPLQRLAAYARFHLEHVYYNMEFLGRNYWQPPMPRAYAPVMTISTVPVVTLAAFAIGVVVSTRRDLGTTLSWVGSLVGASVSGREERRAWSPTLDPATTLLMLLAMAVQYGAWLSPSTPIFGGTKHWMTAYPFLALFAAEGVKVSILVARHRWLRTSLARVLAGAWLEIVAAALVLVPPAKAALHAHPWGLSSYNVLVGGAVGAANLGLNRGFWGYTTGAVTDYLNALPRGTKLYVHDTASQSWDMLVRDGRVRADLRPVWDVGHADVALHHHEKHMGGEEYQAWVALGTVAPDHIAGLDGVPVLWTYRKPK